MHGFLSLAEALKAAVSDVCSQQGHQDKDKHGLNSVGEALHTLPPSTGHEGSEEQNRENACPRAELWAREWAVQLCPAH